MAAWGAVEHPRDDVIIGAELALTYRAVAWMIVIRRVAVGAPENVGQRILVAPPSASLRLTLFPGAGGIACSATTVIPGSSAAAGVDHRVKPLAAAEHRMANGAGFEHLEGAAAAFRHPIGKERVV